jgi:hypothetical protein
MSLKRYDNHFTKLAFANSRNRTWDYG